MCIRDSPCDTLGVYPFIPHQIQRIESTLGEILGENMTEPPRTARLCTVQMYRTKVWILPGISTFVGADIVSDIDVYKRQSYTCPLELTHDIIRGKWKPIILWQLGKGAASPSALQNDIVGIGQKMLLQDVYKRQVYTRQNPESVHCLMKKSLKRTEEYICPFKAVKQTTVFTMDFRKQRGAP